METGVWLLLFVAFAVHWSLPQNPPIKPVIKFNQPTGVYLFGEMGNITCTVTGDTQEKFFEFSLNNKMLHRSPTATVDTFYVVLFEAKHKGGHYKCRYVIYSTISNIVSPMSEAVTAIIADPLITPLISLDETTGVYAVGEAITMTCTVSGFYRERLFYFYKGHLQLSSHPITSNTNTLTIQKTRLSHSGQYKCQYRVSVQSRQFDSQQSQAVTVTIVAPPIKPVITFNKPSGVYLPEEMGNITCTVTGDKRDKTFQLFRNNEVIHLTRTTTQDSFVRFSFPVEQRGGQYQCRYGIYINARWFVSPNSETVTMKIATLPKPNISVDSSGVVRGGAVTFSCRSPGDNPAIAFYLHRQGVANHYGAKSAVLGINSVTFTIRNVDHSEMGKYTCRYEALVDGKNLSSSLSDPVHITVIEKELVGLVAYVGSAVGLILVLALLGVCLWRKAPTLFSTFNPDVSVSGKTTSISETSNVVPSGDQINETITYAVLNQQSNPKRKDGQRDTGHPQGEESTLYAEVKL